MKINLYFEEGPGSGEIGAMVAHWVITIAARLGIDTDRISIIGVATDENYGGAVSHQFPGSGYTFNDAHVGVGKSHTTFDGLEPQHSILFHAHVFEMILQGMDVSGSENFLEWSPEFQLGPFVIAHELGHCRDNELHRWPLIEPLSFPKGFDLGTVHNYYVQILITEVGACLNGDRFYSKDFLFHIFETDSSAFQNHKAELEREKVQGGDDQTYRVACIGSALVWLYIIQYSKIVVGKHGTSFESEKIDRPLAGLTGLELLHPRIENAVTSFCKVFPNEIETFKEEIYAIWESMCEKLGLILTKDEEGWRCYWK